MSVFGLTGGVGMGKTTVADMLSERGVELVDTDSIARQLTAIGGAALPAIVSAFGESVISASGGLDRESMARLVFQNSSERQKLESILHPLIRKQWQSRVVAFQNRSEAHLVVVIPLLFETGVEHAFDRLVCVACSEKDQLLRLAKRGWSEQHSIDRIRSQWPIERKMALCDVVVWTGCSLELSQRQIEGIVAGNEGRSLWDGLETF